jgi:hypothetical protein
MKLQVGQKKHLNSAVSDEKMRFMHLYVHIILWNSRNQYKAEMAHRAQRDF